MYPQRPPGKVLRTFVSGEIGKKKIGNTQTVCETLHGILQEMRINSSAGVRKEKNTDSGESAQSVLQLQEQSSFQQYVRIMYDPRLGIILYIRVEKKEGRRLRYN